MFIVNITKKQIAIVAIVLILCMIIAFSNIPNRIQKIIYKKDYEEYAGCCFMVCDQPLLQKESMQELFKSFYTTPEGIHMCATKKREGNPVIFPKQLFDELMALTGDKGGKRVARLHPELVHKVYVSEKELSDMDYKEDKINLEKEHNKHNMR